MLVVFTEFSLAVLPKIVHAGDDVRGSREYRAFGDRESFVESGTPLVDDDTPLPRSVLVLFDDDGHLGDCAFIPPLFGLLLRHLRAVA